MISSGVPAEPVRLTVEVERALRDGRPTVALETSVLAQGLPTPHNVEASMRMAASVVRHGALPVWTAVMAGRPAAGLSTDELERVVRRTGMSKVSARDLGPIAARGLSGATTVGGTLAIMARVGLAVFATGGIGGVHRGSGYDESSDLIELARTPAVVVCAGAKSVLNLAATLERLETLAVPVIGYKTDEFPAFFCTTSGLPVPHRADSVLEIVDVVRWHRALGRREAVLVVQPPPDESALPRGDVDAAVEAALREAGAQGIQGPRVTPFLLGAVERATSGRSLATNLALLDANAALAAQVAVQLASSGAA